MADEHFTLTTFYTSWNEYQQHIASAVAPLTAEQLAWQAAPNLRSVGELAAHIAGCRAGWFTYVLKEDGGEALTAIASWDQAGAPPHTGAELEAAITETWRFMMDRITRWGPADMQQTFEDDWDGKIVQLSRAWIVWHLLEHDLHHGGELSLTLGMHGIKAEFPG